MGTPALDEDWLNLARGWRSVIGGGYSHGMYATVSGGRNNVLRWLTQQSAAGRRIELSIGPVAQDFHDVFGEEMHALPETKLEHLEKVRIQ